MGTAMEVWQVFRMDDNDAAVTSSCNIDGHDHQAYGWRITGTLVMLVNAYLYSPYVWISG
jgi:hypothetical protein